MGRDATHALVDYARPQAGMQVLDLASGTGEPAITLASRIGPEGHVIALDLSPELLQIAEERAGERDLTNLTTRQADANNLPFPDQSFDLVTSRFGVMFLGEDALREACRVLRRGRELPKKFGSKHERWLRRSSPCSSAFRRKDGMRSTPRCIAQSASTLWETT